MFLLLPDTMSFSTTLFRVGIQISKVICSMPRKYWIQSAVKHPGAFKRYCHRHHMSGATGKCISTGTHSRNSHVRHMAQFARTMRRLHHH